MTRLAEAIGPRVIQVRIVPMQTQLASGVKMESVLFGTMPGALMFRRSYPIGVPDMHSTLSAHLNVVADAPVFAGIPDAERDGLFESLTKTLRRSDCPCP